MHPRERVLGLALLHKKAGTPVPVTLGAEAARLGIELTVIDQQHTQPTETDKETDNECTKLHDT